MTPALRLRAPLLLLLLPSAAAQSYPPRELEPLSDPSGWSVAEVQSWVESIGFEEYAAAFGEGGVDGRTLLGFDASKLEDELLLAAPEHRLVIEMELGELKLRRGLMPPAERQAHLAAHPRTDAWSAADVREFLQEQGLGSYAARFASLDGHALLALSDAQLQDLATGGGTDEVDKATYELLSAQMQYLRERTSTGLNGLKSEL